MAPTPKKMPKEATALSLAIDQAAAELDQVGDHDAPLHKVPPNWTEVRELVEQARQILFPEHGTTVDTDHALPVVLGEWAARLLELAATERHGSCNEAIRDPRACASCCHWGEEIAIRTVRALPQLRALLLVDLKAALDADPAAQGPLEIFLCYPGFYAITSYRIARILWAEGARLLARLVSELAHTKTGIDIHPGAQIDAGFFIDHGTGVVVGETAVIGKSVRLYQGVTLGALSIQKGRRTRPGVKRHPTLEDDVIVYANATILGGDTIVGQGAVVGGNCWITTSVQPGTVVTTKDLES